MNDKTQPQSRSERVSRARPGDEILPTRWRKKPVEIEAIRWSGTNLKEVIDFTGLHPSADQWTWEEYEAVVREKGLKIFSLEGSKFIVTLGDYIIKGVKGEFYACKPDIFMLTYQRADSAPSETAATSLPSAEGRGQLWEVAEKCAEICGYAANEFYDRFPAYAAGASQCETRIRAYAATLKGKP